MSNGTEKAVGLLTIPNGLTVARLVLLPAVIWGISREHGWVAFVAMALIIATDLVDGRLARRLGQASEFGKSLDSTIDFTVIYSLFIALWAARHMPTYQFAFIYLAMLTILLAQLTGMGEGVVKTIFGKPTGALQFLYLLFLILCEVLPKTPGLHSAQLVFFGAVALMIVLNTIECVSLVKRATETAVGEPATDPGALETTGEGGGDRPKAQALGEIDDTE
ncbi:CDP-alcohol phosphatidyltransferase family protein [bacterium]|nr:CDP-alcohol phosphatidyltransferase family protein [bacterium]